MESLTFCNIAWYYYAQFMYFEKIPFVLSGYIRKLT